MMTTPSRHPLNPQVPLTDEAGQPVMMSKTGSVEELIHTSLLQTIIQLITINPSFLPQNPQVVPPLQQVQEFMVEYGDYVGKYLDKKHNAKKKGS